MEHDLLLVEELLLLSVDDEKGSDQTWGGVDPGLAGALLLELMEMGALRVDGENHLVAAGTHVDDPLLSEVLDLVTSAERPRDAGHWISKLPAKLKPLRTRVAGRLVDRGILTEKRKAVLGVTVSHRYPEHDPGPEQGLRARLLSALLDAGEPAPRDALLIVLLRPFELITKNVPSEHRKEAKRRAKEIAETGPVNSAVRKEVEAVQAALVTTVVISTAATAGN